MKINRILPNINLNKVTDTTNQVAEAIVHKIEPKELLTRVSPVRAALEFHAEEMSPEEYLMARNYIADLEMSEFIASEMKYIK